MSQQSVNRSLAWVTGIALVLAIAGVYMGLKDSRRTNDALTAISAKADKSEIPNYGMPGPSAPAENSASQSNGAALVDSESTDSNRGTHKSESTSQSDTGSDRVNK